MRPAIVVSEGIAVVASLISFAISSIVKRSLPKGIRSNMDPASKVVDEPSGNITRSPNPEDLKII